MVRWETGNRSQGALRVVRARIQLIEATVEANSNHRIRFKAFELDLTSRELRRNGVRLKLQGQPLAVLAVLLERTGEVVTREELRRRLWPEDTFVDFEHGLNSAVRRLREGLGDNADDPRFIETVPRVGYRFIAPVQKETGLKAPVPNGHSAEVAEPPAETLLNSSRIQTFPPPVVSEVPIGRPVGRHWVRISSVVIIVLVIALLAWWRTPSPMPMVESVVQLTDDGRPKGTTATDGARIYFNEFDEGRSDEIKQVSIAGGPTAPVETGLNGSFLIGTTRNGAALVVGFDHTGEASGNQLWLVPLPAGEPHRIGNFETWYAGQPSDNRSLDIFPDGRIVFAQYIPGKDEKGSDSRTDYFITDTDGLNARKLISIPGFVRRVSASPKGQRVLIDHEQQGERHLYEIAIDGTGLREIRQPDPDGRNFTWSFDEKYLVYQSGNFHQSDIWLLPVRSGLFQSPGKPIRLTNGPLPFVHPYANPKGTEIFALGMKERAEMVRYDLHSHQFEPFLSGISATDPTFSRDGRWVAYSSYPDRTLWRSRIDGTQRVQLTSSSINMRNPGISPDGTKVSFNTDKGELYVVSMNGGPPQKISENGAWASWSPDGNYLYYQTFAPGGRGGSISDVRNGKKIPVPNTESFWAFWLTQDILVGCTPDYKKLVTFNLRTQEYSDLTSDVLGQVRIQNWMMSPDNKYLYFTTTGAERKVFRLRFSNQQIEPLMDLKNINRVLNFQNTQINVAPDGSPIFSRDTGYQEIYALNLRWP